MTLYLLHRNYITDEKQPLII